jgi:cytochrome c-type biogenesis protein CcmH/NrfG
MAKLHPEEQKKVDNQKLRKKLVMIVSLCAFGFTFGGPFVRMFLQSFEEPTQAEVAQQEAKERRQELQKKIQGYQIVLEREPENRNALEGLAEAQIQLGHTQQAVATLEKLVELYPDNPIYQKKLASLRDSEESIESRKNSEK